MSQHPNAALLTRFYEAFNRMDAAVMRAAYAPDARFDDPAFPGLQGDAIGDMWTMLCERAQDFSLEFRDGKIVRHTDVFDFHRWARQALGPVGLVLGWTGFLRGKVQAQSAKLLADWQKKRATAR